MTAQDTGILLRVTEQLKEAKDLADDWTGKTDAKERRKIQNRLHQRAWRRRKAATQPSATSSGREWHQVTDNASPKACEPNAVSEALAQATTAFIPQPSACPATAVGPTLIPSKKPVQRIPLSIHELMSVNLAESSSPMPPTNKQHPPLIHPVIPYLKPLGCLTQSDIPPFRFPLSPDHYLITLIQYNVLRASITNHAIVSIMHTIPAECRAALTIQLLPRPTTLPPSLLPTPLQKSTIHAPWIDAVPSPPLRDNLIQHYGTWDVDDWCEDVMGGLYEGFDDCKQRGMLVWGDPWREESWEFSEGFVEKWGWMLKGCRELVEATNRWRESRGEERLVVEV
ncbi:uncharacterized protein BDR25DRAFT_343988 [Lindgomyces ingoldianus]|uniref:Uncharacterized protein n=1 Tax=Lindgomyces ingoldianus TaxID=673940 RepID=A0ACB6QP94_9PLEO|nr:uncharacterized protein BDR25DRAFT_343988 [Lindgomyces ingoldianus]KAF2468690.1 hypothetical protein BDR25DRAFT_343988 [Lindgomyces ingoldianus]